MGSATSHFTVDLYAELPSVHHRHRELLETRRR
ncbi:hypothetical protein ACQJBY_063451 [Aegilops geniculata]